MIGRQRNRPAVPPTTTRRIVNEPRPPALRKVIPFTLLAAVICALAFAKVWLALEAYDLGYELRELRDRQSALEKEKEELILKIESLRRLDRVEELASRDAGLVYPPPDQVVILGASPAPDTDELAPEPLEGGGE